MRDDFAIFILSHGRADNVLTLKALQDAGYSGKWFVVVDDLDEELEAYRDNYGDHVIVFDKRAWAERTDTVTATGELRSVVFARNACYEIAEGLGLRFFGEFDDDIMKLLFRYDNGRGQLKGVAIKSLDEVLAAMIEYQENAKLISIGFGCGAGYIGGVKGKFKYGLWRSIHQAFILRTDMRIEFKGILNEDGIATEVCNQTGELAFEILSVSQNCPARASNSGGLNDLYRENDEYIRAFYSVVVIPSALKVMEWRGHISLWREDAKAVPRILHERWKKHA